MFSYAARKFFGFLRNLIKSIQDFCGVASTNTIIPFRLLCKLKAVEMVNGRDKKGAASGNNRVSIAKDGGDAKQKRRFTKILFL